MAARGELETYQAKRQFRRDARAEGPKGGRQDHRAAAAI